MIDDRIVATALAHPIARPRRRVADVMPPRVHSVLADTTLRRAAEIMRIERATAVPVVVWEYALFDDMAMTGTASTQYGTVSGQTALRVLQPAHMLCIALLGPNCIQRGAPCPEGGFSLPRGLAPLIYIISVNKRFPLN